MFLKKIRNLCDKCVPICLICINVFNVDFSYYKTICSINKGIVGRKK